MKKAMQRIEAVAKDSGKVPGIHVVEPKHDELNSRIKQGYRFVAYSLDIRMLDCACRNGLNAITS
jgi:2-dehydro-3-deoxyglucarate aldolase